MKENKNSGIFPGKNFRVAANDYKLFLEKGYPQKAVLTLTGDRYKLNSVERSVLYRGIAKDEEALKRKNKLLESDEIQGLDLNIDGYNVLFTIGSYLSGRLVFISNDGFLRDSSEIHGKAWLKELMDKSLLLLFHYLQTIKPKSAHFYFDEPVSHSGELCSKAGLLLDHYGIPGGATTIYSPDFPLKNLESGIVATSDSVIIDHCKVQLIDLPYRVITKNFRKRIPDVNSFLESS